MPRNIQRQSYQNDTNVSTEAPKAKRAFTDDIQTQKKKKKLCSLVPNSAAGHWASRMICAWLIVQDETSLNLVNTCMHRRQKLNSTMFFWTLGDRVSS